jgi:hypothetical protein
LREWISVHDRLPEKGRMVFVCDQFGQYHKSRIENTVRESKMIQESGGLANAPIIKLRETIRIHWYDLCVNTFTDGKIIHTEGFCLPTGRIVTHWMPLPQPPNQN